MAAAVFITEKHSLMRGTQSLSPGSLSDEQNRLEWRRLAICVADKFGQFLDQTWPWLDPLWDENDFRKGARRLSYTEICGSLLSQILILLQVHIQAPESCDRAALTSISHGFHLFWRGPCVSEHKCVSHYQSEDSWSQVTETELPSMVSSLSCVCCI